MTDSNCSIKHLAIIMDGNSRWAEENKLLQADGYRRGAEAIKLLLPEVIECKIPYLTLYAFSSENWQRPKYEISFLMGLLKSYLQSEAESLHNSNIKLKVIGRLDNLPSNTRKKIDEVVELTKNNSAMTLCLAFGYGGRFEIIDACKKIIENKTDISLVEDFKKYLYDPEMPDVDLLIRTGNVYRISNFLLWQSAYAELYFLSKYWPEFNKDDLTAAIKNYKERRRTFGK